VQLAADQISVEAQLKYAKCLMGGDDIEADQREAEHYLNARIQYVIVLLSGQLGRFEISRARIELSPAAL
jgi:hypothetical protein